MPHSGALHQNKKRRKKLKCGIFPPPSAEGWRVPGATVAPDTTQFYTPPSLRRTRNWWDD